MNHILCKNCPFFEPNGGTSSFGAIYPGRGEPVKLGYCRKEDSAFFNRLKNEHNACLSFEQSKKEETK